MKHQYIVILLAALFSQHSQAAEDSKKPPADRVCETALTVGEYEVIPSGNDSDVIRELESAANAIFGENGAAAQLGLALPPQMVEFAPSSELSILATLGRHAIGHWYDGSQIATQSARAAGVLEFVTPGCPTCRSFYSDMTSLKHQISVLMHVAGHNDFATHSMYNNVRPSDPIRDSLLLYELMEKLYREHDHDEVSQWYQYLLSMTHMQDLTRSTFDSPESLAPKSGDAPLIPVQHAVGSETGRGNAYGNRRHPKRPTSSILQAVVANLPANTPAWKKEVAFLFEKMNRVMGYYTAAKIMNEGWASLMQEMLAQYAPWQDSDYSIEHASLMTGVAPPALSNPYWLGRECWRVLRRRFNERPENRDLRGLELDRKFVKYAHDIIAGTNDYDFILMALDEQWVMKHELFLHRPATFAERDASLPPPNDPSLQNPEQKVVVTTDYRRIVGYIARSIADRSFAIPQVLLENFNDYGGNVVSLRHEVVDNIPLKKAKTAQALFVMSQIMERPVSLKTIDVYQDLDVSVPIFSSRFSDTPAPALVRQIRIEVAPSGRTTVFDLVTGEIIAGLTEELQKTISAYQHDLNESVNQDLVETAMSQFIPKVATAVLDQHLGPHVHMASHSPTAARALFEYASMIDRRLAKALQRLINKKTPPKVRNNNIRLKVLPDIPEFEFDHAARDLLPKGDPTPIDMNVFLPPSARRKDRDVDLGSGSGRRQTGRRFWGNSRRGQGNGNGGDEPGRGEPGEGAGESTEIDVPLELYAELLAEEIALPNLRPKPGLDEVKDDVREGGVHRPFGNILWTRMADRALALGEESYRRRGVDTRSIDRKRLLKEGFKRILPSDYVVSDRDHEPSPDIKAVVVIWLDMTGSMNGDPIQRAQELTFNLKALLSLKYKKLEFRYVGFTTVGVEFTEDKFFKSFMGGGTDYGSGLAKTKEILESYNPAQYDRFSFGIGDAEDVAAPRTAQLLGEVVEMTQYSAFVYTNMHGGMFNMGFLDLVKSVADQEPYFGFAEVDRRPESSMEALVKLFGKNKGRDP